MSKDTALLIIDLQKEDCFALERFDYVVENAAALTDLARTLGISLFYTRHINEAHGADLMLGEPVDNSGRPTSYLDGTRAIEILDALAPCEGDIVLDKYRYSAFHGTRLAQMLKRRNVKNLIVIGVLTDVCVMTSVFDAYQHDFNITIVSDACTATTLAAHYSALFILSNWVYGLKIVTTAQLIKRWRGQPATCLVTEKPDHLAFQPEAFVEAIQRLENSLDER